MKKVSFETEDGVRIVGDFYPAPQTQRAILLLHMMPATKESWQEFAGQLLKAGWNALAIDLRGHGESVSLLRNGDTAEQELDYRRFIDKEHQASYQDIEAAKEWLAEKGFKLQAIAGASIGANLALWYQSDYNDILKTVLLSAGFNYRGIETRPLVQELEEPQGIYLVGGLQDLRSDGSTCGQAARELYELAPVSNKQLEVLDTPAHGTDLFQAEPALMERIISWLS